MPGFVPFSHFVKNWIGTVFNSPVDRRTADFRKYGLQLIWKVVKLSFVEGEPKRNYRLNLLEGPLTGCKPHVFNCGKEVRIMTNGFIPWLEYTDGFFRSGLFSKQMPFSDCGRSCYKTHLRLTNDHLIGFKIG